MAEIIENCYCFENEGMMRAMCIDCASVEKTIPKWFWNGVDAGYGGHDVNCSICNKIIYKNDNKEIQDKTPI